MFFDSNDSNSLFCYDRIVFIFILRSFGTLGSLTQGRMDLHVEKNKESLLNLEVHEMASWSSLSSKGEYYTFLDFFA